MKKYINLLRQYVSENPIRFDDDSEFPALETLYWNYCEGHCMSNDQTKVAMQALDEYFSGLSFDEHNRIFILIGRLCAEHERIAFLAGLRLGAQLMLEIMEPSII